MAQRDPYFDTMTERQPLVWAAAVRRQLERWEPLVALHTLTGLQKNQKPAPKHRSLLVCLRSGRARVSTTSS
jgi:hypothetical protein